MKKISAFILSVVLLAGCSSFLPKSPPARLYTLNPPQVSLNTGSRLPYSLQIVVPQAAPGLDTERIALRKSDNQIDYYADARWAGNLTNLVQSLLVESFDNSGTFRSTGNDLVEMQRDYSLLVEIRDFQMESYQGHDTAHVRLVAKLMKADTQKVMFTRSYNERMESGEQTMAAIMKAFDKAYQSASRKLVNDINQYAKR